MDPNLGKDGQERLTSICKMTQVLASSRKLLKSEPLTLTFEQCLEQLANNKEDDESGVRRVDEKIVAEKQLI